MMRGGGGGRGTQASQSPPSPSYNEVAQRSAVDGNAADATSTSTSGWSNTRAKNMDFVSGVVIRSRAQSLAARTWTQRLTAREEAKALMDTVSAVALHVVA